MFISQQLIKFNDVQIKFDHDSDLLLIKKINVDDINLMTNQIAFFVNAKNVIRSNLSFKDQYVAQRVRNAYMISICQSKIFYDLFHAVQFIDFIDDNIKVFNKRLQWQINNKSKKLKFVKLNKNNLQLIIFTNLSFVNNKNLFSQINFVICLIDK